MKMSMEHCWRYTSNVVWKPKYLQTYLSAVLLYSAQIRCGPTWDWTQTSAVRGRGITVWVAEGFIGNLRLRVSGKPIDSSRVSSAPADKLPDNNSIMPQLPPFKSCPIHHHTPVAVFCLRHWDDVRCERRPMKHKLKPSASRYWPVQFNCPPLPCLFVYLLLCFPLGVLTVPQIFCRQPDFILSRLWQEFSLSVKFQETQYINNKCTSTLFSSKLF